jgi:hypothetical protein
LTAFAAARRSPRPTRLTLWSREAEAVANPSPASTYDILRLGAAARGSFGAGREKGAQRLALARRLWQEAKRFFGAARLKMLQ